MDKPFELPVTYKGAGLLFPAELLVMGYVYKIRVDVYGQELLFEADEERNFRALSDPEKAGTFKTIDRELLQAIAASIESLVK
jgi:hypothetical protein